jgi:hypothetical protein
VVIIINVVGLVVEERYRKEELAMGMLGVLLVVGC